MKCEVVEQALARYLSGEISPSEKRAISDHLEECTSCRAALAFHRKLEHGMAGSIAAPSSLEDRVFRGASSPRPSWIIRVLGDPTMKKIALSTTAVTALVAGVALLVPRSAGASTPVETLSKMRSALAAAARDGELTIVASADKSGNVHITGTLDGNPLPDNLPMTVHVTREGNVCDVGVRIDLAESAFSSIKYGKDDHTLVLTPKGQAGTQFQVGLDEKTMQPKTWSTWKADGSTWKMLSERTYKPRATKAPEKQSDVIADVHIKILNGTSGTITVSEG